MAVESRTIRPAPPGGDNSLKLSPFSLRYIDFEFFVDETTLGWRPSLPPAQPERGVGVAHNGSSDAVPI